jgi:hypothetical protein
MCCVFQSSEEERLYLASRRRPQLIGPEDLARQCQEWSRNPELDIDQSASSICSVTAQSGTCVINSGGLKSGGPTIASGPHWQWSPAPKFNGVKDCPVELRRGDAV